MPARDWPTWSRGGNATDPKPRELVRRFVEPVLAAGADTLVLGCTHYTFLAPLVAQVAGPGVEGDRSRVAPWRRRPPGCCKPVGSAPATDIGDAEYFTTADPHLLSLALSRLVGQASVEHAAC